MKEELQKSILSITTREELHEAFELLKRMQTHLRSVAIVNFHVGDKVSFTNNGIKHVGIIKKINPTTVKVFVEKTNVTWRCTGGCLNKES